MRDVSFVTRTRVPYVMLITLFGLFACGHGIMAAFAYILQMGGCLRTSLFLVLAYPQPPMRLILVRCRATPDNMVSSASYFVRRVCLVEICVRGIREGVRQDAQCWSVGHKL